MINILAIKERNRQKMKLIITFFFQFDRQRADGGPLTVTIAEMPSAGRYSNADWDVCNHSSGDIMIRNKNKCTWTTPRSKKKNNKKK